MCVLKFECLLQLVVIVSVAATTTSKQLFFVEDICDRCQCLPGPYNPTQAICRDDGSADKVFSPTTNKNTATLELIYVYGMQKVNIMKDSLVTENRVTLLIQNCSEVILSDRAMHHLRTLVIRGVGHVTVGELPTQDLWAVVLEDIDELAVSCASLIANCSVSISHIRALTLWPSPKEAVCNYSLNYSFTLFSSVVKPVPKGGISLCCSNVTVNSNTFESVAEEAFQITSERNIVIVNNRFGHLSKQAFNLSSPEIFISGNYFKNLPAGALRSVSTLQETFFTNNTITDIDLGGVLLDMGWDMVIEGNVLDCDCASKRTSILNPKQDMLYLTNSSLEKLHNIFLYNFCNLNCTITLKTFSYALIQGEVCVTNDTKLEEELLCHIATETETINTNSFDPTNSNTEIPFVQSAASKLQYYLVPICIFVASLFITSSICYGCKETHSFKFTFDPHREPSPKVSIQ